MRNSVLWIGGAVFLSACIFGGNEEVKRQPGSTVILTPGGLKPGTYRDFGPSYAQYNIESELVFESNAQYHWFGVQANIAFYDERGQWRAGANSLVLSQRVYSNADPIFEPGVFSYFDVAPSDTTAIRAVNDTSFERREYFGDSLIWVPYRRVAANSLSPGLYVHRDTLALSDSQSLVTRIEYRFESGGGLTYNVFQNDGPVFEIESAHWSKTGTFLVISEPRRRYYDTSITAWLPWADTLKGGELAWRVRTVGDTLLQEWEGGSDSLVYRKEL